MPTVPSDEEFLAYNLGVINEFRANHGVVSQPPFPILLLTTTGARTEAVADALAQVLAIAVAVVIVFFVISSLVHILHLIGVGLLIAAALFAAFKGWEQYKRARERRQQHLQQREERRAGPSIEAPWQQPTGLPPTATPSGFDVDEELARLKRELPDS